MEDCSPNWTPTGPTVLGADKNGPLMSDTWNYASIVGMLLYLSQYRICGVLGCTLFLFFLSNLTRMLSKVFYAI